MQHGLTSSEAAKRLAERGEFEQHASSRSYGSIVRENVLTLFNLMLASCAAALIATGQIADLLFVGVIVVNASIGIWQEIRTKHTLERLALLVAPRARTVRDGNELELAVDDVVAGDAIAIGPGDQVVADGTLVEARSLSLDESILTGESDSVSRRAGESVQSGSFCLAGSGVYLAERVGADAYAAELTGAAKATRSTLSPLQQDINRLLRLLIMVMVPIAAALIYSLHLHKTPVREAVATAVAGIVTLVPEGLVLLASVAFAVGAARIARRGALVQRLNAIESLAGVDVVCIDKTGTLTDGTLVFEEVVAQPGHGEAELRALLGRYAASLGGRNATVDAVHEALGGPAAPVTVEVPFSSRWKWSGLTYADGSSLVLGAPEALGGLPAELQQAASERATKRLRVLLFARALAPLREPGEGDPVRPPIEPLGLIALSERMRTDAEETIGFLKRVGVAVKVISGDGPQTVAAVARAVGLEGGVITGPELPTDRASLRLAVDQNVVFARVQPEQKREIVEALQAQRKRVAMIGDGVNDVPAMKTCEVAVALGSGSQIAKGVADLVLVTPNFSAVPAAIEEGRRILINVRRCAKLFVAKSVFAAVLVLTVGIGGGTYPFLPRQLSLTASLTVGIPAFFLALAPPAPGRGSERFLRDIARFAVPGGVVLGLAVLLGYGLVHASLGRSLAQSQTTSVTILTLVGLYLVLVLESGGMRASRQRGTLVPLLVALLVCGYVAVLLFEPVRSYFALAAPSLLPFVVSVVCTIFAIGALGALGLSLTRPGGEEPQLVRFWQRAR